ncbi:MAG TPA: immunoglobulin-like domain-containing protein [Pyrinomonadaceae bacterium]
MLGAISFYSASSARNLDVSLMLNRMPGASVLRPAAPLSVETIDTFASDCATPKNSFFLGNTVCAQATGAPPPFLGVKQRRFQWIAPDGTVARLADITLDPQNDSYTIPTTGPFAQVGTWAVRTIKNNGSVATLTRFVVRDPSNARVDLNVTKISQLEVKAGGNAVYTVTVENRGPDDAQNVTLTDDVPANMTFLSDTQNFGPSFTCTDPAVGSGGTISCTLATLAVGDSATFSFNFLVDSGTPVHTSISNTATASSQTPELFPANNSSTAFVGVSGTTGGNQCTIDCPADISVPHDAGQASATVSYPAPTTGGSNCGPVSCSKASGTSFAVGTTIVLCTAGTDTECSFAVTVEDNVNPTISCPSDINATEDTPGSGIATVTYTTPSASDDSGSVSVSCDRPSGSSFPVGTTTVTCTAADAGGNEATCSFDVNVTGTGTCDLHCPADLVVDINNGACGTIVNYPAPAATNCGTVHSSPASGTFFNVGVTTVTVTTTAGQSCDFTVTVREHTPPVVVAPAPASATADANCMATVPDFVAGLNASDNCTDSDFLIVVQNPAAGTQVTGAGPHNVAITVTDASNNSTTVNTTFTLNDVTPPVITVNGANPLTVECHSAFTDPGATAHDACAGDFAATASSNVNANVPGSYTITYTASDPSGNAATPVTRTVVVVDTLAPVITVNGANPMTVECHTTFTDPGATASDACAGTVPVTASGTVDANTPGTYTITYTASDGNGHTTTATRTVNVVDTLAPVITINGANPMTVECHTGFTDPGATAVDSCAGNRPVTVTGSVNANVPGTYTLTYTASDGNGHTTTATRTVNVVDTTAPTLTLNNQTQQMWPPNHKYVTFNLTQFVVSASDGCDGTVSINNVVISKVTSDEAENSGGDGNTLNDIVIASNCKSVQLRSERDGGSNGRVYTITFLVRDAAGNTTTKTAKVIVPHSGNGSGAVDDGPHYTVNSNCP